MSFSSKQAMLDMNHSFQQMFTSKRKKGKTWDSEAKTGPLWIWMGAFKRWKLRIFSAAQPGLLTYLSRTSANKPGKSSSKRRRHNSSSGAINLHGATLFTSDADSRLLVITTQGGSKFYLRTTDSKDLEPCVNNIREAAAAYKTMLSRASLITKGQPAEIEQKVLSLKEPAALGAALGAAPTLVRGELRVVKELHDRVNQRMEELRPYEEAVEDHVAAIQDSLNSVSQALDLKITSNKSLSNRSSDVARQTTARLQDASQSQDAGRDMFRVDSFQSCMSELQRSPTAHSASYQGASSEGPLSQSWQLYRIAIEDGIRAEATRVVELQNENEALKTALRNFKVQAQSNAKRLKNMSPRNSQAGQTGSSESDEDSTNHTLASRQESMEDWSYREGLNGMSDSIGHEYQQALEALEVVQKHAFAVTSAYNRVPSITEPPPEDPLENEDAGSEDEIHSEVTSRHPSTVLDPEHTESVWEVAGQRDRLPQSAPLSRGFSIWSVLKSAIGKDLTRITLPATINEPLSALQRIAEDLEYRHLLDKAMVTADIGERTLLVAAFIASGYSATLRRESKPFNPLLGETFEWQSADSSCRLLVEQVSHHPPVSCWWSESSAGWWYWGEMELRSKFWGKSVEMLPTGTCWLRLGDELWSWNKANMSINNIILGTYWLDWYGQITIHNHRAGTSTVMQFPKSSGRHLDKRGTVLCSAESSSGKTLELQGMYTNELVIGPSNSEDQRHEVFRINPPAEQGSLQYNMTRMAMTLNTAEPELLKQLPPTDSRFRPDQRALEDGEPEKATVEKLRLEEKQRQARKERKENGESFFPSWFKLMRVDKQQAAGADHWLGSQLVRLPNEPPPCMWQFTSEYWAAKSASDWNRCPDIYSGGVDPLPSPYGNRV